MTYYVGCDVSLKETHLCILQDGGGVVARGCVGTAPGALAAWLSAQAPEASVVVLETGGLSSWLAEGLGKFGLPAVVVDARLAKKALSGRANKNDQNDAEGLAALTGWYRRVVAKSQATREQLCSHRRARWWEDKERQNANEQNIVPRRDEWLGRTPKVRLRPLEREIRPRGWDIGTPATSKAIMRRAVTSAPTRPRRQP